MSRAARYTGLFGGGKYDFQLNIGELEELQEKTDAGPEELYLRVSEGRWRVQDIRETLRLGLKGAGMEAMTALAMVDRYAGPGTFVRLKPLVTSILGAAMVGAPDEDLDAPSGEMEGEPGLSPVESSGSGSIMKSVEP